MARAGRFRGFPAEAIEFYEGLEADNTRAYWQDHKDVYESAVKAPMEALLADLASPFGEAHLFRPYRDVRFSKDKSPYKTAIAASLAQGGYVQLSADGLMAGSGMYMMAPDQLDRFRRAVDDERSGRALEKVVDRLRASGCEVGAHDTLKSAPRDYAKDHPRIELLRHKGLVVWKQWTVGAWLGTAKAKERVVELFRGAKPLTRWLDQHVGESQA